MSSPITYKGGPLDGRLGTSRSLRKGQLLRIPRYTADYRRLLGHEVYKYEGGPGRVATFVAFERDGESRK